VASINNPSVLVRNRNVYDVSEHIKIHIIEGLIRFRTIWELEARLLKDTKTDLEKSEQSLVAIIKQIEVMAAKQKWNEALDFCNGLLNPRVSEEPILPIAT
jgi:hypothetical protein